MNYTEALNYIHSTRTFGIKLGLENISKLLELLGNPQKNLKFIHVAGTNGKGSTSSFISNMLIEEGYKVGLFTSPYLEKFTERIRINNKEIDEERLAHITETIKEKVVEMINLGYNHPTEFEIVTAIALKFYYEENTDIVVLEVGLGGRYDSTNVIDKPIAAVITPIAMDHVNILGDTLEKIAYEKAGIIKEDSIVISAKQEKEAMDVIKNVVNEKNGELNIIDESDINILETNEFGSTFNYKNNDSTYNDLKIKLLGEHQVANASLALKTILTLKEKKLINVSNDSILNGLYNTTWIGRLEVLRRSPTFVIDGAHNTHGANSLRKSIQNIFNYNNLILGIGMLGDKDVESVVSLLAPLAHKIIITEAKMPRAKKAEDLAKIIEKYNGNYIIEEEINNAVKTVMDEAGKDDLIVFSGSLYIIGDVRKIVKSM